MYHYLINALTGRRAEYASDNNNFGGIPAVDSAEVARAAQRKEREECHRVLAERRRAYTEFVNNAALGKVLARRLPRVEDIPAYPEDVPSAAQTKYARKALDIDYDEDSIPGSRSLASSIHDAREAAANTLLEYELYMALTPLLTRGTAIVTARALELLGNSEARSAEADSDREMPLAELKERIAASVSQDRFPFIFVSLLLQRWMMCLQALAAEVFGKTPSAHTLRTLLDFSCILASFVAITEVHTEEVLAYLKDLRIVMVQCVEESLRCLQALTNAHTASTFYAPGGATAAPASELLSDSFSMAAQSATAPSPLAQSNHVAEEAVRVQTWCLISLLLYWMHMVHSAPVPHLNVVNVFLSTSTAALDPANNLVSRKAKGDAGDDTAKYTKDSQELPSTHVLDEIHRCTGLSNEALWHQEYALPDSALSATPGTRLHSVSSKDGLSRPTAAAATATSFPLALMTSAKIRESLLWLLLTASKGVILNDASSFPHHFTGLFKKLSTIEVDDDLGFAVVLVCRLLHDAFAKCASASSVVTTTPAAEQVCAAVGPLLGALSILLARFIAEEHTQDANKSVSDGTERELRSANDAEHIDPTAPMFASSLGISHVPVSAPVEAEMVMKSGAGDAQHGRPCDLPAIQHSGYLRLLGQLSCGILLLTTFFHLSAQIVLDTMDHSFFIDALVTALQVTGRRFDESSADATGRKESNVEAAQAWSRWVSAVDMMSKEGAVPCRYDDAAHLDALLDAALVLPVDHHLAVLCDDPFVDEFLHTYLGLLAESLCLRFTPVRTLISRRPLNDNSSLSSNQNLRLEMRSLDTLDQLEQTLVKTFLTAYDVSDAIPDALSANNLNSVHFAESGSPSWNAVTKNETGEVEERRQRVTGPAKASPFPATSCLYNLLLKHALWCLSMSRRYRHVAHSQPSQLPPPAQHLFSHTTVESSKQSFVQIPESTFPLTPPPSLLPSSIAPSYPVASSSSDPFNGILEGIPARTAAADVSWQGDDSFLLFLVHRGLFRILLHDEHYASAFMVKLPRITATKAGTNVDHTTESTVQLTGERPAVWQRSFATLFLLSQCLQLHPGTVSEATVAAAGVQDGAVERLTPREELLAFETAEALIMVLRSPSYASLSSPHPPPASGSVAVGALADAASHTTHTTATITTPPRCGVQWCHCLLALLAAALGTTAELQRRTFTECSGDRTRNDAKDKQSAFSTAPVVSEALVRCGGVEYLLEASITSAAFPASPAQEVSFRWTMCTLQGLVTGPKARLHMAATCARSLLFGVFWNPMLRHGGRELLTSLLCQPLVSFYTATGAPAIDPREAAAVALGFGNKANISASSSSSSATNTATNAPGTFAVAMTHAVPHHCRKLCESLWRVLNECVNGPLPASCTAAEAYGNEVVSPSLPSASTSSNEEREAVLQCVLSSLVDAFNELGSTEELLPLRTLQQGIFVTSREGSMHIYALLLHHLAQAWRSNTPTPSSPSLSTSSARSLPNVPAAVGMPSSANMPLSSAKTGSTPPPMMTGATLPNAAVTSRERVVLITKVLVGLTKANPTQREMLYRNTVDEDALVDCIANAWMATAHRAAHNSFSRSNRPIRSDDAASDECEWVRLCSYLVYESIGDLDAFLNDGNTNAADNIYDQQQQQPSLAHPCTWSLQNPALLSAVLKRFPRTSPSPTQQCALRQLLSTLTHTVASCQTSLYLAASTSLHETLAQLLPVIALLPPEASDTVPNCSASLSVSTTSVASTSTRLDVMLVHLLVMLTRCHIDARQLKQLLMLVIHSKQPRERRALVPLAVQLLSAAAQPVPSAAPRQMRNRTPQHFITFHRGCGLVGFRAALSEFPLEGYSVALYLRWEGELDTAAGEEKNVEATPVPGLDTVVRPTNETGPRRVSRYACIFSLRTADRITVMALMVERRTGRLFVQYCNLQKEVRVYVAKVLPSREWSQVMLSHRPAAFLTTAAGGQLHIAVNNKYAVTVPQVTYPLMSRGYLYVGCLGHEVDRLSVAHAFYGQVSNMYFFPFVLQDREREILQNAARGSESAASMMTLTPISTPPLRSAATTAAGNRWPGAGALSGSGGSSGTETGTAQSLADRATLRVDTRMGDRGHLYNLAAVLRGRVGRDSRIFTFEGTLVCCTQWVIDSMGLLGAMPSVVMPLCTLLVNPTLPISFRGLVAVTQNTREPSALPPWAMVPSVNTGVAYGPHTVNAINAAVLWALELIPALAASEAIRNEMSDSGLFVFLGQILQLLGSSLQVVVPAALIPLLESLAPFPRLFEDALTNLFLSSEVIHAAPRIVQLTWVSVQNAFLRSYPGALSVLRTLGTSMFVAAEVLRVTSEEDSECNAEEQNTDPTAPPSSSPPANTEASCSLHDLEHQWMSYFEALTAPLVTISEAQSLQYLIENLRWSCAKEAVQLRILRRVRHLVASPTSAFFAQLLGRKNYAVTLIPYVKDSPSEAVRMEALLQFLCIVFRSKRTQELMNPVLLTSRATVVHVAEEVSLAWLKDVLRPFPMNLSVYLALRCAVVGQFDVQEMPTSYTPLDETQALKFAAVLLPLLMLLKRSTDSKLKAYVLTDLAVLLKSDAQAWRRMITVRGWYVSLANFLAPSCSSTVTDTAAVVAPSAILSPDKVGASPENTESSVPPQRSELLFSTLSMILSYTLFKALLHETYGATELALVAAYLREKRLHRLLHQVLCNIADRFRSRLLSPRSDRREFSTGNSGGLEEAGEAPRAASTPSPAASGSRSGTVSLPTAAVSAVSFLGLGTPTSLVNLCYFFHTVEFVLFYASTSPKRETTAAAPTPLSIAAVAQSSSRPLEGAVPASPSHLSYIEWDELSLLPVGAAGAAANYNSSSSSAPETTSAKIAHTFVDVYYAGEEADPQGYVQQTILCNPDGRWLHLPLAAKCSELLCSHSALLHLGSNANTMSISIGASGAVSGATTSTGGPGDALLAAVMSAASGNSGAVASANPGYAGSAVRKGGMLRLFGRLLNVMCRMTLRSAPALESIINAVDGFIRHVDRGQRGSGFLLLKRTVNADEAHEHSPIAVSMTVVYDIHDLLLRRLRDAVSGGSASYPNVNAALVDRMKSVVEIFRHSFEQLHAFASVNASRAASPTTLQAPLLRHRRESEETGGGEGRGTLYLGNITGEVYTAGVPTLQWLCDHQANPHRTVEAFAEVASRSDYNAFVERCLIALEREQMTNKILAYDLVQEQRWVMRRLQDLFCENSLSRRLVHDNIKAIMEASRAARKGGTKEIVVSPADESANNSFNSFFLPSAAKKVTAAARAATWARFTTALRGTVWNLEAAGQKQQQCTPTATNKYVKLSAQEQQALVHRKLIADNEGTNYSSVSMASYSSPTLPTSENNSPCYSMSVGSDVVLSDDATEVDTHCASRLRLRGGEAVLLQALDDEDAAVEEDLAQLSTEEDMRVLTRSSVNELAIRDIQELDQIHKSPPSAAAPYNSTVPSVLSVPCEVPYMMHCWSASFTVRGSEAFVLIDDENKAYNQVVGDDAKPYLLRPRTFSFHLSHVTQIAPGRRFRMRRTALEVWTRDRRSYFINYADTDTMNAALQALRAGGTPRYPIIVPSLLHSATGTAMTALPALIRQAAGGGSRHIVYVLQENPRREPMRLRAMALWRNRLLSNFDYLLVLNLLAGRTLNDMTQYPVFPWILSDYTSSKLDLANPSTFRDLSLPMGACGNEERRAMVRERYTEMKDLGDVPSHYFTHYSSPAVTLYFLVRLPPYTTLSILLQGGHFDHADRMFHSMQASFRAVTTSTQDVRELIPELFYLPELCINANRVDFGNLQDRTPMDDLQLPPWAHNDPYTFTYRMREALESPYVSAHLHEWIDLIFGYKQRGKDAIDALNVFNWHSYEELDRNRDTDTVDRQLLIDLLDNIGQTPIQLFRRPHLPRPMPEWADPLLLPTHVKVLPLRWGCVRVAKVVVLATDKVLVITGSGGAASLRMHLHLIRKSAVPLTPSSSAGSLGGGATAAGPASAVGHTPGRKSPGALIGVSQPPERAPLPSYSGYRGAHPGQLLTSGAAALSNVGGPFLASADTGSFDVSEEYERRIVPIPAGVIPNNSLYTDGSCTASSVTLLSYDTEVFLVLGGLFDNSVVIRSLSGAAGDVRLRAHHGQVTLVVRTGDSRYLVTGAEDTTFAVWSCQLQPDRQQLEVELLFTIYGHEDMPSSADVSGTLDIVATASLDGVLMLHSLSTGSLDRVIRHPQNAAIHRVLVQSSCYVPNLIFLSNQDGCVHQYSINGAHLRTFTPPGRVMAWAITPSQYFLLACQPYPYARSCGASSSSKGLHNSTGQGDASFAPPPPLQAGTASCILYVHSFFLEVVKTVPVPAGHFVSSLSAHPSYPQVVVAGTENGCLLLLRSVS